MSFVNRFIGNEVHSCWFQCAENKEQDTFRKRKDVQVMLRYRAEKKYFCCIREGTVGWHFGCGNELHGTREGAHCCDLQLTMLPPDLFGTGSFALRNS